MFTVQDLSGFTRSDVCVQDSCFSIKWPGGDAFILVFHELLGSLNAALRLGDYFADQETVLQRKFHTISFPYRELHLTMTQTSSLHNYKLTGQTSTRQSQVSSQCNTTVCVPEH